MRHASLPTKFFSTVGIAIAMLLGFSVVWAGPKVTICHIPPGNPANFHTIKVSQNAYSAHLAHGDLAGACNEVCATLCDDGNACTIDDAGNCEQDGCPETSQPVDCNDGNACTNDSCDAVLGCQHTPGGSGACQVNRPSRAK